MSGPFSSSLSARVAALPVDGYPVLPTRQTGEANATISADFTFSTSGVMRSGWIQLNQVNYAFANFFPGPDSPNTQTADVSVGGLSENCVALASAQTCTGNIISPITRFAFTLGEDFHFHEDLTLDASSFPDSPVLEDGMAFTNFGFELFEGDGVTPVQMVSVPEPATFVMLGLVLTATWGFGWLRRATSPAPRG